jgi:predicted DNA-binding antitoxin AbrB/MazE fold protein
MADLIRAIYEHGRLRPLDPVRLTDGQEIRLAILSERDQVRLALADLLPPAAGSPVEDLDEAAILALLDAELQGNVAVSDAILEERRAGP